MQPMKKWENNAIKHIMDNFDFERVHKAMELLDWTWGDRKDDPFVVPSIDRIEEVAKDTLKGAIKRKCYISSGGFVAEYHKGVIRLMFCIDDIDYYKAENEEKNND